jgi:hypothetical protein
MRKNLQFGVVGEAELNEILAGRRAGHGMHWSGGKRNFRLSNGATGVIWREADRPNDPIQPVLLVSREEENRRLCGRFAQLRSDLSPLTVWCHLLTPERFEVLDDLSRDADLGGYEAAWIGLVIAEALLLAERSVSNLKIAACLSTQTFGVARSLALWGSRVSRAEILERFDSAHRLFRSGEPAGVRLRPSLQLIWDSLAGAASGEFFSGNAELRPVIESLRRLNDARIAGDNHAVHSFVRPLLEIAPEAVALTDLSSLAPEERLREFDRLVSRLKNVDLDNEPRRRLVLCLLAGFLATVAAGGAPSLPLAEAIAAQFPEITAWAYVIGGIGERVVWTSGFDGLGRLVARELMRPLRLDEPPTCDVAFDEAKVLVDPELRDPLVYLKLKQSRIVSLALLPGVNIAIPITETSATTRVLDVRPGERLSEADLYPRGVRDVLAVLADSLWPYLQTRLEEPSRNTSAGRSSNRGDDNLKRRRIFRGRADPQGGLPLKEPKK